jgi:fructosamine-3-kinase
VTVDLLPGRAAWRPLGGGSICDVYAADLVDGTPAVVKVTPYDPRVEADGLAALREAGAPVPAVLAVDGDLLVLERLADEGVPPSSADWEALGGALADVHRRTAQRYGWHVDNLIGSLPQRNGWRDTWSAFYAEQRIRPWLGAPALPAAVRRRLEQALEGPLHALLPERPPASLVHGDLWSGNVVAGRWLIDPAVCHADREYELAFMDVFGGFPAGLWAAYEAAWPLDPGWRERRPALQLYHLLVHVQLFGGGYVGSVVSRLDALGW